MTFNCDSTLSQPRPPTTTTTVACLFLFALPQFVTLERYVLTGLSFNLAQAALTSTCFVIVTALAQHVSTGTMIPFADASPFLSFRSMFFLLSLFLSCSPLEVIWFSHKVFSLSKTNTAKYNINSCTGGLLVWCVFTFSFSTTMEEKGVDGELS